MKNKTVTISVETAEKSYFAIEAVMVAMLDEFPFIDKPDFLKAYYELQRGIYDEQE